MDLYRIRYHHFFDPSGWRRNVNFLEEYRIGPGWIPRMSSDLPPLVQ